MINFTGALHGFFEFPAVPNIRFGKLHPPRETFPEFCDVPLYSRAAQIVVDMDWPVFEQITQRDICADETGAAGDQSVSLLHVASLNHQAAGGKLFLHLAETV